MPRTRLRIFFLALPFSGIGSSGLRLGYGTASAVVSRVGLLNLSAAWGILSLVSTVASTNSGLSIALSKSVESLNDHYGWDDFDVKLQERVNDGALGNEDWSLIEYDDMPIPMAKYDNVIGEPAPGKDRIYAWFANLRNNVVREFSINFDHQRRLFGEAHPSSDQINPPNAPFN